MVIEMPEWKFKPNIAKNATFEENQDQIFVKLGQKRQKMIIFEVFTLVSQSHKW